MSLAEKFEKISLDEVANIVAAVKKDGIEKSGLADNYEVLLARIGSKDEKESVAACKAVVSLMTEAPESQVFVKECLGACKSCHVKINLVACQKMTKGNRYGGNVEFLFESFNSNSVSSVNTCVKL